MREKGEEKKKSVSRRYMNKKMQKQISEFVSSYCLVQGNLDQQPWGHDQYDFEGIGLSEQKIRSHQDHAAEALDCAHYQKKAQPYKA